MMESDYKYKQTVFDNLARNIALNLNSLFQEEGFFDARKEAAMFKFVKKVNNANAKTKKNLIEM
jgi:hypothetical protein